MKNQKMAAAQINKRRKARQLILSSIVLSGSLLYQPQSVFADNAQQHYEIQQGDLATVLNQFASRGGILLSADAALTSGKSSQGLSGDYATEQGLNLILAGTGLTFTKSADNSYYLERKPAPKQQQNFTLDNSTDSVDLDVLMVMGTPQFRYDSREVKTGTRIAKDVTEMARSVDIIPEQLLLDSQAREMEDVYKLSPNVVNSDGYGGTREDYLIRGFRRPADIYRNGVRLKTGRRIDPATVDNIQIIKGPVADIGQMMPGGLVNIITKKPQLTSENHLSTSFDEHGQRRAVFDSTGAIADSDNLAYRVTGSWEDSDTFRDNSDIDRRFLSSSVSWFGDQGEYIDVNYEYSKEKRSFDRGVITVPLANGKRKIADVSSNTSYDAGFSFNDVESNLLEIDTVFPISQTGWNIESKLFYNTEKADDTHVEVRGAATDGTITRRVQGNEDRELNTFFARLQARGEFSLFLPMTLVSGVEYHEQDEEWINFVGSNQTGGTVTNPNSYSLINDIATASRDHRDVNMKSYGPFAQLDMQAADNITITLGFREEFYSADFERRVLSSGVVTTADTPRDSKFTKSAGIVWNIIPEVSLYTSYADTFMAQNVYTGQQQQTALPPQEGRQYEAGVKWSTFDDRLLLTMAYFDIKQENVYESVNGEAELTGGIDTNGIEFSVAGSPVSGWNIRASLGLLDAEIVSEDTETNGNRPTNVPEHTANLWTSYEFQGVDNPLSGFGIGGGITHVGNRYGDSEHSFDLGDYTLVDAGIWYYFPAMGDSTLRADLGVKNITDEEYYTASGGDYRISVGAPRTVFAGLRLDF